LEIKNVKCSFTFNSLLLGFLFESRWRRRSSIKRSLPFNSLLLGFLFESFYMWSFKENQNFMLSIPSYWDFSLNPIKLYNAPLRHKVTFNSLLLGFLFESNIPQGATITTAYIFQFPLTGISLWISDWPYSRRYRRQCN